MGRSKAKQLELDRAEAQRAVDFHYENMMWKHYLAEDMTNEGGYDRTPTSYDSVLNGLMKPSAESMDSSVVKHLHGYLDALGRLRGVKNAPHKH
jgi:hypothetical protein